MKRKSRRVYKRPKSKILQHFAKIGFTNRLAIYIMLFLAAGLAGGFYLAMRSITNGYTGALMCWTVVFTPIGTVAGSVIGKIVDKSKAENTGGNGEGIKYTLAVAGAIKQNERDSNSPAI